MNWLFSIQQKSFYVQSPFTYSLSLLNIINDWSSKKKFHIISTKFECKSKKQNITLIKEEMTIKSVNIVSELIEFIKIISKLIITFEIEFYSKNSTTYFNGK